MTCSIGDITTFLLCCGSGDEVSRSLEIVGGKGGAAKVVFHQDFLFKKHFFDLQACCKLSLGCCTKVLMISFWKYQHICPGDWY